jgi:NADH dehydrogenase (ubiquinone) Fe-S protein 1
MGLKIVEPPGQSRDQWEIIRALSEECGVTLPYNSVEELRSRIYSIAPHLLKYDFIEPTVYGKVAAKKSGETGQIQATPLLDLIDNYYMTDSISRNSITMAKCSTAFNPVKFSNFQKIRQQF